MLIAFYKPFDVLSQFTRDVPTHHTLAEFGFGPGVYPIGRLDRDSEGLLLLSDEARWTDLLLNPKRAHPRTYHAQVEGLVEDSALLALRRGGLDLKDFRTRPCLATRLDTEPEHPPRSPPIRYRKSIPTTWLELTLTEGKNRQVRRMTATVGSPTLRLIRVAMGGLTISDLGLTPGKWRPLTPAEVQRLLA